MTTVISSGDRGVELAALKAAKESGLRTAGFAIAASPQLQERFGLINIDLAELDDDCSANVAVADACVVIGKRTRRVNVIITEMQEQGKPVLLLDHRKAGAHQLFRLWACRNKVQTLLVTGHTDANSDDVYSFLREELPKCCR